MSASPAGSPHAIPVIFVRHGESVNNTLMEALGGDRKRFELERHMDAPLTALGGRQIEAVAKRVAGDVAERDQAAASPASTSPLTEKAAEVVTNAFADAPIGAGVLITTSYFHRALKTAEAVHRALPGSQVAVWRDIHEVGGHYRRLPESEGGGFAASAGRTSADVRQEFPSFAVEDDCPEGWYHGKGTRETSEEALARARHLTARLEKEIAAASRNEVRPGQTTPLKCIVVITHGDFFRTWLSAVFSEDQIRSFVSRSPMVRTFEGKTVVPNTAVTVAEWRGASISHDVASEQRKEDAIHPAGWSVPLFNCAAHLDDTTI